MRVVVAAALLTCAVFACGGSTPAPQGAPAPTASVAPELAPDDESPATPPPSPKDQCPQPPCWGGPHR